MHPRNIASSIVLGLCLLGFLPAHAQEPADAVPAENGESLADLVQRYALGTINSTERADQALEDVKRQRAALAARFANEEAVCYDKFFVTSCLDKAKLRQRAALKQLNAIEVEANAFHRRARAEQRDQSLRERQAKQDAKAAERNEPVQSSDAGMPASPKDVADVENRASEANAAQNVPSGSRYNAERAAQHAQEQAKRREKEREEEKKREENIKRYERKQQRSLERQRDIEERMQNKQ